MTTITPFLWFDDNAGPAVERYLEVFDDAEIVDENRMPDGTLFIATIRLHGQTLTLMNGGPDHRLSEAFSLSVSVETQDEVDTISDALIAGGGEQGPCGWLVDAFGLSWQIIPTLLMRLMSDPDREKAGRTQAAMMQMKRLDLQALQDAYDGV
ncbi:VOC family protein [Aeromicrobium sp. NPDC092404]|uniref:VOC family protein n=1 Tax=Aeromicrobium sp. NPDC092404 TaxID=3154976 RepID=UPI003433E5C5